MFLILKVKNYLSVFFAIVFLLSLVYFSIQRIPLDLEYLQW